MKNTTDPVTKKSSLQVVHVAGVSNQPQQNSDPLANHVLVNAGFRNLKFRGDKRTSAYIPEGTNYFLEFDGLPEQRVAATIIRRVKGFADLTVDSGRILTSRKVGDGKQLEISVNGSKLSRWSLTCNAAGIVKLATTPPPPALPEEPKAETPPPAPVPPPEMKEPIEPVIGTAAPEESIQMPAATPATPQKRGKLGRPRDPVLTEQKITGGFKNLSRAVAIFTSTEYEELESWVVAQNGTLTAKLELLDKASSVISNARLRIEASMPSEKKNQPVLGK
jgi:hypothetical protein